MAQDMFLLRVYPPKGALSYEVTIAADSGGQAKQIAERQNPGCKVVLIGKAK